MTGTHTQNPIYSRITMALMEDTGWYLPNYAMAEELKWGRGLGCDFYLESCKEWMDKRAKAGKSIHPYCNKVFDGFFSGLRIRIHIQIADPDPVGQK
jgi:leishmanolysin-like peptidase